MNSRKIVTGASVFICVIAVSALSATNYASIKQDQALQRAQLNDLQHAITKLTQQQQGVEENLVSDTIPVSGVTNASLANSDLSGSVEQLQSVVAALARKMLAFEAQSVAEAEQEAGQSEQGLQQTPAEPKEEISTEQKFDNLSQRVATSATQNPEWASQTTSTIENLFLTESKYVDLESTSVACGDKLCSVDVVIPAHIDNFNQQELEWHILFDVQKLLPEVTYSYDPIPGGGKKLTYYFAEKGQDLSGG